MEEYIYSLENNAEAMSEKEWREYINKEISDLKLQDPNVKIINIDEVIKRLTEDGFVK